MNTVYTTNNPNPDSPKEDAMSTPSTQQRRVKVVKPTTPEASKPEAPKAKEKRAAKVKVPAQPAASAPEAPKAKARRISPEAKAAAEAVGNAPQPDATPVKPTKGTKATKKAKEPTAKELDQLAQNLLVLDSLDDPHGDLTTYFGEPFVGGGPLDPTLDTVTNPRLVLWKEAYRKKVTAPDLPDHHGKFYKFGRYDISMIATTMVDGIPVTALYPLDGNLALGFNAEQFSTDVGGKFEVIPEDADEFDAFLLKWAKGLAAHGGENLVPETD